MNTERRHRVTFSRTEVLEALKAHRPDCITTQAIPIFSGGRPGEQPAVMDMGSGVLSFTWTRMSPEGTPA